MINQRVGERFHRVCVPHLNLTWLQYLWELGNSPTIAKAVTNLTSHEVFSQTYNLFGNSLKLPQVLNNTLELTILLPQWACVVWIRCVLSSKNKHHTARIQNSPRICSPGIKFWFLGPDGCFLCVSSFFIHEWQRKDPVEFGFFNILNFKFFHHLLKRPCGA